MSAKNPAYDVHPSVAYAQAILRNLSERTGRSLEEWLAALDAATAGGDLRQRKGWLKEQGLGGTTAQLIAQRSLGQARESLEEEAYLAAARRYVEAQYGGAKAALRPIYDRLLADVRALGPDVRVCPCKTIVPFYRHHVFAEAKPATRSRVDLGLALKGWDGALPEALIDTGGLAKGDRITHRLPLTRPEDLEGPATVWLRRAYDLDGEA